MMFVSHMLFIAGRNGPKNAGPLYFQKLDAGYTGSIRFYSLLFSLLTVTLTNETQRAL